MKINLGTAHLQPAYLAGLRATMHQEVSKRCGVLQAFSAAMAPVVWIALACCIWNSAGQWRNVPVTQACQVENVGTNQMFDDELDSFKRAIDLRVYAASHGYQLDQRESSRASAVMRHPNGDKIIIKLDADGHYVYCSVRDDRDHGTIIDLLQKRKHLTLGAIRKELRPWLGPVPPFCRAFGPTLTRL